jgi:hypothetical protein
MITRIRPIRFAQLAAERFGKRMQLAWKQLSRAESRLIRGSCSVKSPGRAILEREVERSE